METVKVVKNFGTYLKVKNQDCLIDWAKNMSTIKIRMISSSELMERWTFPFKKITEWAGLDQREMRQILDTLNLRYLPSHLNKDKM